MGGYQSESGGGGGLSLVRNKGFYVVAENSPFPPGVKDEFWVIKSSEGAVLNSTYHVDNGDILVCLKDNPGGFDFSESWFVIPRASDFDDGLPDEEEEP